GLAHAIFQLIIIGIIGVASTYTFNRLMVYVGQGTMRRIRVDLFTHMESLPIKYFDTHAHGDIMSIYTNDVDTLRQLISQSIPQVVNSTFSIVTTFVSMLVLNVPLSALSLFMVVILLYVARKIAAQSSKYFHDQQNDLGRVNGFIEEMMDGQKVVKVFNHEERAKEEFRKLNQELRESATNANIFANIFLKFMNPINCGAVAMVGGLIIVPIVSLFTPKMDKNFVDKIFACYDQKVEVTKKTVLVEDGEDEETGDK
nr:ABC transporter ATP-binding protein [Treponema sp.]